MRSKLGLNVKSPKPRKRNWNDWAAILEYLVYTALGVYEERVSNSRFPSRLGVPLNAESHGFSGNWDF
jgi:hypothetical protein